MNTITVFERLKAAVDGFRRGFSVKSVVNTLFMGRISVGGRYSTGPLSMHVDVQKLRHFSKNPIVRRLINYLRDQVSRLEYDIVPDVGTTAPTKMSKKAERVKLLLRRPNPDDVWQTWLGKIIEDFCVVGNSFIEIRKLGLTEFPVALWPVDATTMGIDEEWRGEIAKPRYYQFNYYDIRKSNEISFRNDEMTHWKITPRTCSPFGLGPVEVASEQISYFLDAQSFASRTASDAKPKKLVMLNGVSEQELRAIREYIQNEIAGTGDIPILGNNRPDGSVNSVELGLTTDQNLFLKWQEFLIAVISDAFGIDVTKVNLIVGLNRSTADNVDDVTDEGAIAPLAGLIEQYMTTYILPLYGLEGMRFKFRFTTSMSDLKAISTVNQIELQDESITIDEARERMGKPPLLHWKTKEPIGQLTLSSYRTLMKDINFVTGGLKAIEEAKRNEVAEMARNDSELGENSNNRNSDPSQRGGNGVFSAPRPRETPVNQRSDKSLET